MTGQARSSTGLLLAYCVILQLAQSTRAFFWLRATTVYGEYDLDINSFLSANQVDKRLTLKEWDYCVDFDEATQQPTLSSTTLPKSWCSFDADFHDTSWTIRATSEPRRIEVKNPGLYDTISDVTRRPRLEIGRPMEGPDYLTMGPSRINTVQAAKWKAYRPLTSHPVRTGMATRQVEGTVSPSDTTFAKITPFGNSNVDLGKVITRVLPSTGSTEDKFLYQYGSEFGVQEVRSHLQHGDFLVLEGGKTHIQVCFRRTNTIAPDGTLTQVIKPSYVEVYNFDRGPLHEAGVVGCVEIMFRVYTDISEDRRVPDVPEESLLVAELNNESREDIEEPKIVIPIAGTLDSGVEWSPVTFGLNSASRLEAEEGGLDLEPESEGQAIKQERPAPEMRPQMLPPPNRQPKNGRTTGANKINLAAPNWYPNDPSLGQQRQLGREGPSAMNLGGQQSMNFNLREPQIMNSNPGGPHSMNLNPGGQQMQSTNLNLGGQQGMNLAGWHGFNSPLWEDTLPNNPFSRENLARSLKLRHEAQELKFLETIWSDEPRDEDNIERDRPFAEDLYISSNDYVFGNIQPQSFRRLLQGQVTMDQGGLSDEEGNWPIPVEDEPVELSRATMLRLRAMAEERAREQAEKDNQDFLPQ
ncbi:hypothetical protein DRE_00257 [Drechslerella stenobrocha 248]|uniref:Uncharacterized protein n=1 Tax=Drechslerella stenobrocha 248 TaxID=1043628 RepID=W7IA02_9PEZI|nr:hypothetical protein DRE_00257 [Drechslerella stenobrocha 248]